MMRITIAFLALLAFAPMLHAQQWGDLTGKFVFDGPAPDRNAPTGTSLVA